MISGEDACEGRRPLFPLLGAVAGSATRRAGGPLASLQARQPPRGLGSLLDVELRTKAGDWGYCNIFPSKGRSSFSLPPRSRACSSVAGAALLLLVRMSVLLSGGRTALVPSSSSPHGAVAGSLFVLCSHVVVCFPCLSFPVCISTQLSPRTAAAWGGQACHRAPGSPVHYHPRLRSCCKV